jgi:hypothetical protein
MRETVSTVRNRLRARRWRRGNEVPFEQVVLRWARVGTFLFVAFWVVLAVVVIALILS